jgi:hypothetical protein
MKLVGILLLAPWPLVLAAQTWYIVPGPNDSGTDVFKPSNTFASGIPASNQIYPTGTLSNEFVLPSTASSSGGNDASLPNPCDYQDVFTDGLSQWNPGVEYYGVNESSPIYRGGSPGGGVSLNRSTSMTNIAGLAVQVTLTGTGTSGTNQQQSIFYHSQRCYTAGTEFGFYRNVDGVTADQTSFVFYYSDNTNCYNVANYCEVYEGAEIGWVEITNNVFTGIPISIPQCPNSASSGTDYSWRYQAWLSESGSSYYWNVNVIDPYTLDAPPSTSQGISCSASNNSSLSNPIDSSWAPMSATGYTAYSGYADAMINNAGLAGYITLTSALLSGSPLSSGPTMTAVRIWSPTY